MKNVMRKAWEIAKEGQKKFGGKVKEYFAQALKMAWAIVKKGVDQIKFQIVPTKKSNYFAVRDLEGLTVTHHNLFESIGRSFTKKEEIKKYTLANNKKTNEVYRFYKYIPGNGKIVVEANGQTHVFENAK